MTENVDGKTVDDVRGWSAVRLEGIYFIVHDDTGTKIPVEQSDIGELKALLQSIENDIYGIDPKADKPTKEELLDEIERLVGELGGTPTRDDMDEKGKYSAYRYAMRFESWTQALEEVGLEPVHGPYRVTEEELVQELQRLADELDRTPRTVDMDKYGEYSYPTYLSRFGGWSIALDEAGLIDRDDGEQE